MNIDLSVGAVNDADISGFVAVMPNPIRSEDALRLAAHPAPSSDRCDSKDKGIDE